MNWQQIIKDTEAFNSFWVNKNINFLQSEVIIKLGDDYARSLKKN